MSSIESLGPRSIKIEPASLQNVPNPSLADTRKHVQSVNYFLRFIDTKHKSPDKLGMISIGDIISGLQNELVYFKDKASDASLNFQEALIVNQMHKLLESFTHAFTAIAKLTLAYQNNEISEEELKDQTLQLTLYFLPVVLSSLKNITFLHSSFIEALFLLDMKDNNDLLLIEQTMDELVSYFSSMEHSLLDLNEPIIKDSLTIDALADYLVGFHSQIEHFETILNLISRDLGAKDLAENSSIGEVLKLTGNIEQLNISIGKIIKERLDSESVSEQTLDQARLDYEKFIEEIRVPS